MRERAEQRFGIRTEKAFDSGPHAMPRGKYQEFVVVGGFLHMGNARDGRGNAKDLFKVRDFWFLRAWLFSAQVPEFRLRKRKAARDDPCFLQDQGVKLRQLNADTRFVWVAGDCGRNRPAVPEKEMGRCL